MIQKKNIEQDKRITMKDLAIEIMKIEDRLDRLEKMAQESWNPMLLRHETELFRIVQCKPWWKRLLKL